MKELKISAEKLKRYIINVDDPQIVLDAIVHNWGTGDGNILLRNEVYDFFKMFYGYRFYEFVLDPDILKLDVGEEEQ